MKDYLIYWHNLIDGSVPLEKQLEQAQWCVRALGGLIGLQKKGAIEIGEGYSTPSFVSWGVLDEEAYKKAQKEYDLPDGEDRDDEE